MVRHCQSFLAAIQSTVTRGTQNSMVRFWIHPGSIQWNFPIEIAWPFCRLGQKLRISEAFGCIVSPLKSGPRIPSGWWFKIRWGYQHSVKPRDILILEYITYYQIHCLCVQTSASICGFLASFKTPRTLFTKPKSNHQHIRSDATVHLCLIDHSVPWSQSMVTFIWLCNLSLFQLG